MPKRVALSLVVVAVALLFSSAVFAESPAPAVSSEAFLASLQTPGAAASPGPSLNGIQNEPAPVFLALPACSGSCCIYQCVRCTPTTVKLCATNTCTGQNGCEACHVAPACAI
jgi:hypothetical protein